MSNKLTFILLYRIILFPILLTLKIQHFVNQENGLIDFVYFRLNYPMTFTSILLQFTISVLQMFAQIFYYLPVCSTFILLTNCLLLQKRLENISSKLI